MKEYRPEKLITLRMLWPIFIYSVFVVSLVTKTIDLEKIFSGIFRDTIFPILFVGVFFIFLTIVALIYFGARKMIIGPKLNFIIKIRDSQIILKKDKTQYLSLENVVEFGRVVVSRDSTACFVKVNDKEHVFCTPDHFLFIKDLTKYFEDKDYGVIKKDVPKGFNLDRKSVV